VAVVAEVTMSGEEDILSLSDPDSEGEGPQIRPPQAKGDRGAAGHGSGRKHGEKKRRSHEDREERRRQRRKEEQDKGGKGRDRDNRRREDRGSRDRRDRDRDRSRGSGSGMNSQDASDLRHRLVERHKDRYNERQVVERKNYEREERSDRSFDRERGSDRVSRPERQEQDARMNKFIRANQHMEESRRNVDDRRKSESARKKRKQIEKEMMKLQAKIGRKVEAGRSRSGSKDSRRRKSESGEESVEEESEEAGSGEEGSNDGESEESESDGANSDATTGSQKSEETPNREQDSEGEVHDEEMEVDEAKEASRSRSPEEVSAGGGRSRWADRSPSGERTPSRSPTPLREDTPLLEDTPPGGAQGASPAPKSRTESPAPPPPVAQKPVEPPINRFPSLPPYLPSVHGCRSVAEFQCMNRIEEGTYGVVYRAKDKRTNEIVALKKLKMEREKEGFPITSLREINTLLIAQHVNVVTVREIVVGSNMDQIFIVMDFVQHDLKGLMETMRKKNQVFLAGEVKCLMQQLLRAIHHLHDNWILHRDLKASNLLLSHNGILKVGDFGLAREYGSPLKNYTAIVVTLWYRAPELLLGIKQYSTHIDVWSIGCILGELLMMEPLFPGKSEVDELNKIFKLLGTPTEKVWPGYKELPGVRSMKFVDFPVSKLREKFPERMLSDTGLELMKGLLTYDPRQRMTCAGALEHPWFLENPRPIDPSMFPTWPAKSEQDPGAKKAASPPPPSGGGAFKNIDDDEARVSRARGFNLTEAVIAAPPAAGWNLKF